MKRKQPVKGISRREFAAKMAMGALTVPFLMQTLGNHLNAQELVNKQEIFWLRHQFSGNHSCGLFDHPEFSEYLNEYFQLVTDENFLSADDLTGDSEKRPIVILEGAFPELNPEFRKKLGNLFLKSRAVILLGNEAAFSTFHENQAGEMIKLLNKTDVAYIKLPGSPVNNRHLLGTLNHLFLYGVPELDAAYRPKMFFSSKVCDHCEFRKDFDDAKFVKSYGTDEGCLFRLGCKGPFTYNDCPVEKRNGSGEWCVSVGSPCTGCSEASFPDHAGVGLYGPLNTDNGKSVYVNYANSIAKGVLAVTVAGIAVHAISKRTPLPLEERELDEFYGEEDFNE